MKELDIEIKKILLAGLHNNACQIPTLVTGILENLMDLYHITHSSEYVISASQYILAYVQLGFSYLEQADLFNSILQEAEFSPERISSFQKMNPVVVLNKGQLRSIIGRWRASKHNSHTISAVLDDIISHVENKDLGTFQFYTASPDDSYTSLYQLTITPDYALFHDVFQNKFYRLVTAN